MPIPTTDGFVEVTDTRGDTRRVPAAWVDDPELGAGFRPTPFQAAFSTPEDERPTRSWTQPDLVEFAETYRIDLGDAETKTAVLAAVTQFLTDGDAALAEAAEPVPDLAAPVVPATDPDLIGDHDDPPPTGDTPDPDSPDPSGQTPTSQEN